MPPKTLLMKTYGKEETHVKPSIQRLGAPVTMLTLERASNIPTHPNCVVLALTQITQPSNHLSRKHGMD